MMPDFDPQKDYYKILGVPPSSSEKDIKMTYYKLAQELHPDKNQGKTTDRFKEVTAAYNVLGNKDKRSQYDSMRVYSQQGPQH
jgi:DnaJ-class molecular chaperone